MFRGATLFIAIWLVTACGGGGPAATPTTAPGGVASPGATPGQTAAQSAGGSTQSFTAGAAKASVNINGKNVEFTNGTCKTGSTVLNTFDLVSGEAAKPPSIDIYIADASNPIKDGTYTGGLVLVAMFVDKDSYVVNKLTVTLRDGLGTGEFSGTNANPEFPVTGTFSCR